MPDITIPNWSSMSHLGTQSFIVAIILTSQNLALIKLMAARFGGKIDYNKVSVLYFIVTAWLVMLNLLYL